MTELDRLLAAHPLEALARGALASVPHRLPPTARTAAPEPALPPDGRWLVADPLGRPAPTGESTPGLDLTVAAVAAAPPPPAHAPRLSVNPTLVVLAPAGPPSPAPDRRPTLLWRHPLTRRTVVRRADAGGLFALALARSGGDEEAAAAAAGVAADALAGVVDDAVAAGLVLAPPRGLHRWPETPPVTGAPEALRVSHHFALQWHLTNQCDLHCRHCYDRADRTTLSLAQALVVVDDVRAFCRRHRVGGELCLTGGNPLLYRHFTPLYRAIAATDLEVSILGNPVTRRRIEALVDVRRPAQYQVSLEGLEPHDDAIRGRGHFRRTVEFLGWLRELDMPSAVMLTLTRANLDQVLPLAERLRGLTDVFCFNRLAQVGEGADLEIPTAAEHAAFLDRYERAALDDPALGFKDNLFNVGRHRREVPLIDGCTGFGCGAAFNFVALLPDGEVHACRKLPSPIGHLLRDRLAAIWASPAAQAWRDGAVACRGCPIRPWCGGCPAVTHGAGLDALADRDPQCSIARPP